MKAWEEKVRQSDAARISPEAAETLIAQGGEGEPPVLPLAPSLPEVEPGE